MNNKGSKFFVLSLLCNYIGALTLSFLLFTHLKNWSGIIPDCIYIILTVIWWIFAITADASYENLMSRINNLEEEFKKIKKDDEK